MAMMTEVSTARRSVLAVLAAAAMFLAGCATAPPGPGPGPDRYGTTYGPPPPPPGHGRAARTCPRDQCGVVQDVMQVYIQGNDQSRVLGTIIGAVVGGTLGNTIGKGDGRKAATVAGAVAGGVIGNQVARSNSGDVPAWRIVVRLDDGRMATVTQRENPDVRQGDYVRIEQGHVYLH